MEYVLTQDITSRTNKKTVYARKGERVKVIAKDGHVMIVESEKGERFSVTENKVIINH